MTTGYSEKNVTFCAYTRYLEHPDIINTAVSKNSGTEMS
jgi:hypothetical protein